MLLNSGIASFTLRQKRIERLGTTMLPFLAYVAIAAWIFPNAARLFREARLGTPSTFGRWRFLLVPFMLAALPLTFLAGYENWLHNIPLRHVCNFATALCIPAAYHVFYSLAPPHKRGVWYGTGMAVGILLWRMLVLRSLRNGGEAELFSGLYAVYVTQIAVTTALFAVAVYGMTLIPPEPPGENSLFFVGDGSATVRRRTVCLLFAATCSVYVMNALIDIRMFPMLLDRTASPFDPMQLLATLMAAGYYLLSREIHLTNKPDSAASTHVGEPDCVASTGGNEGVSPNEIELLFERHNLTPREREVAALWLQGASTREMGVALGISENTVKTHVKNILAKLGVANRTALFTTMLKEKA